VGSTKLPKSKAHADANSFSLAVQSVSMYVRKGRGWIRIADLILRVYAKAGLCTPQKPISHQLEHQPDHYTCLGPAPLPPQPHAGWGYDIRVEICDESADAIQVINFVAVCQE
jgi:hypothetical protein